MYDIKVRETVLCVREQFSVHTACPHRKGYITLIKGETGNGANVGLLQAILYFDSPSFQRFCVRRKSLCWSVSVIRETRSLRSRRLPVITIKEI